MILLWPSVLMAQGRMVSVRELNNQIFKKDGYWRGADGAGTIELNSGKILWLFSDTFIDQAGTGIRANSGKMIRNSIALQSSDSLTSPITYYYGGTRQEPDDFFKIPGKNWLWTGQGAVIGDKLVIFLFEETSIPTGMGFETVGWHVAIVDNPEETPDVWRISYFKGADTYGVIVGSSAVLQDDDYVYAFGVKEPGTHETYLLRFDKNRLVEGDLSEMEWWVESKWTDKVFEEPDSSLLFTGQTEFSVHFDKQLKKYIQIQTYGFGKASIGYRLADHLTGPWSASVIFYTPALKEAKEFVYTARAHPEYSTDRIIITYNINNFDFGRLLNDEEIYFPKIIQLIWEDKY